MSDYSDRQDALFQELDARKIESLKADLKRRGLGKEADKLLKSLYAAKVPQSQIIDMLERLPPDADSN